MEEKYETQPLKGVKIRTLNTCMMLLSSVIFIFLIYNSVVMPSQYHQLVTSTDEYIVCEKDATSLSQASDYLTEQVRLYVQNMDITYMDRYFEEVHVTRRRENALEELERHETTDTVRKSLESALQSSNDLMNREIYAMKLVSLANGYSPDKLPQEVREMQLKVEDASLLPEEMVEKARELVFDSGYQDAKALIRSHLDHFTTGVLETMAERQKNCEDVLSASLSRQRVLVTLLFIMNVITFTAISILIIRPLTIHIKRIKDNELLEITGSYEFRYLAVTYNDIYELNAANQAMLEQKAEHDPLTGLMNRSAYDDIKLVMRDSAIPVALVLLDVDRFKQVNDKHGHEAGDRTLKKVAALLTRTFRSSDYIIHLGGDEFAVVMPEMERGNLAVLERKIASMNAFLQKPEDGLPPVSLSAGIAFSKEGFREDMFNQADEALYYVKEHGRCGYSVYGAERKNGHE